MGHQLQNAARLYEVIGRKLRCTTEPLSSKQLYDDLEVREIAPSLDLVSNILSYFYRIKHALIRTPCVDRTAKSIRYAYIWRKDAAPVSYHAAPTRKTRSNSAQVSIKLEITLSIHGQQISLSLDEARHLLSDLQQIQGLQSCSN